jgi:predicted PurR-regulated permease PerM
MPTAFPRGTKNALDKSMAYSVVRLTTGSETTDADRPSRPVLSSRLLIPILAGIFGMLVIFGLRAASSLFVPIAVAALLTLLLGPLVRAMRAYGVAEPVGAGVIVFGTMITMAVTLTILARPAALWLRRAPATLRVVESRLRELEPFSAIQAAAASLEVTQGRPAAPIQVVSAPPLKHVGWRTANAVTSILTLSFLTYFLLASGSMFRRKIAYLFPSGTHRSRIKRALFEIEEQMSRYLLINTAISAAFGLATWMLLAAIGIPNPVLWGAVAGLLNFVPYLGALVTVVLIGIVALASFDGSGYVVLACGGFLLLDLLKGNLVSPLVIGRKMPLNTVAVFVCLMFWGWVWGVPGVIMAVPLTVMIQVICAHSERFRGVAILLGQWGSAPPNLGGVARRSTSS